MTRSLRLGTRRSPLSLIQAQWVAQQLQTLGWAVEIVPFVTQGDRILDQALADFGGKGLFTHEIEAALLQGTLDIAVHSLKDMPTVLPEGLVLGAIPLREDARDVWVSRHHAFPTWADLPPGATVGTSSLRRQVQLKRACPHLNVVDLRGNIGTRLEKLNQNVVDGVILALAGFKRLNFLESVTKILSLEEMLPAVAQGALAIECRQDRLDMLAALQPLHHAPTAACVLLERGFLRALDGSCRTPIAGHGAWQGDRLFFQGFVATIQGDHASQISSFYDPERGLSPEEFGFQQGMELARRHEKG